MDFQQPMPLSSIRNSKRLSGSGQLIGWSVFGSLVVAGFVFGVVMGYDRPKAIAIAKAPKEADAPKVDSPKTEAPKADGAKPKTGPETFVPVQPITASKDNSAPKPVVVVKEDPKPMAPVAVKPKDDPKPPMPVVATPPKTDPPAKKEELKAVSFKTEVLPILRTHCLNCHGGGKGKPKGNVDLTTLAKLKNSQSPGKILVPGQPDKSDVYTSITERDMPDGGKPKPSQQELKIIENWIRSGAKE